MGQYKLCTGKHSLNQFTSTDLRIIENKRDYQGNKISKQKFLILQQSVQTTQLYNCKTIQLYKCATVQLYNCTNVQLYNYTTVQMYNCTTIQLYNYSCSTTVAQLYNCTYLYCTTVQLLHCSTVCLKTVQLFDCSTVHLSIYIPVQLNNCTYAYRRKHNIFILSLNKKLNKN